jgi:para-nitrobenzyl esterase
LRPRRAPSREARSAERWDFFANFIKTGDPNGPGLPKWPAYTEAGGFQRMTIDVDSRAEPENLARFLLLDQILRKQR